MSVLNLKNILNYLSPKKSVSSSIIFGLVISGIFCSVLYVFAVPPADKYNPGDTLDPNCTPGSTNCTVTTPAVYSFGTNNFSGTGTVTAGGFLVNTKFAVDVNGNLTKINNITYSWPVNDGDNGQVLTTNGSGTLSWAAGGGSMVYPGAGIAVSTGSAWGTSLTDSSANWNSAYSAMHTQGTDSSVNSSLSGVLFATTGTLSTKAIGTDIQAYDAELAGLSSLSYASGTPFVKMTAAGTFSLDTSTYLTSVTAHNLLSATHGDTTTGSAVRGDIITAQGASPTWTRKAKGSAGQLITFDANDVVYTTATYPGTATGTGTILRADGTNWVATTATYPTTTTANQLLYSSSANVIGGLTSGNSSVLVTDGSGVPSLSTTLPASIILSNTTNIGATTGVGISATNGVLTLAGQKSAGNNENLTVDFETTSNKVAIGTGTSVTDITTTLALTVGNLTDSGLTATRVTYAGASGLLSDSADFTFASGNLTLGAASTSTGKLSIKGTTSGTVDITTAAAAGTWTMTLPTTDGDSGQVLQTNGSGVTSWVAQSAAMTYPGAGIAVSTGSAWGTSLTDSSANWNSAYSAMHTQGTDSSVNSSLSGVLFATTGTLSTKAIGTDIQAYDAELAGLSSLSYASGTPFVKMTAAGTFALDTNTYLTSLSGALLATGATTGATSQAQIFTNGVKLSNLTSGRVPYATTDGLLTDSANLTFDGTTLTAAAITTNSAGTGITMSGASGVLTMGGVGNTNNENLTFDFETTSNAVGISSTTGVTNITWPQTLTLGAASTATGKLSIKGTTSGTVDITTAAAAGTWTMTLPTTDGDSGQYLQTNGSGVTSWATVSAGMSNPMTTIGDIIYASDTATPATPARLAGGSTGQVLQSNTGAAPSWSTATYPSTATGTGTILRADGTNWVASTATYPNTTTANQILYSTATNVVGGDSGLTFDGTTMIVGSSTEVFTVLDTGKVGISATSPTYDLSFGGNAARTISMERNTTTSGANLTISAGGALSGGTNLNGGQLYIKGGTSTGSGGSSDIFFQTATAGSSGTSDNTPTTKLTIRGNGNVVVGTAALATDATGGFLYIPSSAGTPTGTPTTETGTVPIQYDTTNNALYAYRGGAWHYFAETAGFQIPDYEKIDPISGEEIKEGDFVLGMVNGTMPNDNLHGIWISWNSVKTQLLAEARGELSRTSGTWGTGTVDGVEGVTFLEKVKNILFSLGIEIKDGVTNIATLATKKFSADTADIKQVSIETMQMVDKTTGEIYCTWISNGQLVKAKGECSTIDFSDASASVITTASQTAVETPVTTPVETPAETTASVQTEPATPEAVQTQTQTTELTQQQQHAIEQAADQAAREASQQTASRISDEVADKVQDKIEKEVKKEIEQQLKESGNVEEPSLNEQQQEELPVVEPEASLEPPIESATEETAPVEEVPSTGDLIQEATSSLLREAIDAIKNLLPASFKAITAELLSAFGDFSSWMSKNVSQGISNASKIIQASKAGLIEIAQDGSKDFIKQAKIGLEIKTPEIMEKSTAGFLAPVKNFFK